jgi:hypothetical protein
MGSISIRDAASALKSGTVLKVRDAASALKTVQTIKLRDAAGLLKTAYDVGGGGAGASVSVTPSVKATNSDTVNNNTSSFTAAFTGGSPSSIVWSIQSATGGTATIVSGQGTATASIKLTNTGAAGTTASCTIKCVAVIGGVSYNDTATKTHKLNVVSGGGGSGTVSIDNQTLVRTSLHGTACQYNLNADGNVYGPTASALLEAWLDSGSAGSFEARATLLSGALTTGTTGVWQALSTTRTWTATLASIKIEIRRVSDGVILDTATISLEADATGGGSE